MKTNDNPYANFPLGLAPDALVALADFADVGIWNWHIPSNEISLNEPIVKLTGYKMYEIPHSGNTRQRLTFADDYAMVEDNVKACLEGRQDRYQIIYRMNRKDGSIVSVLESAFVYERDEKGRAVRLAGMVLDLSLLKHSEKKIQDLESENRSLRAGMSKGEMASQIHLLRAANAAAASIVGGFYQDYNTVLLQALKTIGESLDADNMQIYRNLQETSEEPACYLRAQWQTGQLMPTLVEPEQKWNYADLMPNCLEKLLAGHDLHFTLGEIPPGLYSLPGIGQAKVTLLIPLHLHGAFWGMLRVDDWKEERLFSESDAEITKASIIIVASSISRNETLSKLNEAREEAMASTKAKSEFLSRMSHEIRTPMNAIIGMAAIARKSDDLTKVKYALDKIDGSSKQLLSIINDVLDMSKIDSGKFEISLEPFSFDKMLQNVINVVQVKVDEKHQTLHFELENVFTRKVISDELRLSQVLINLLGNAVKFTPTEGHITLKVSNTAVDAESFLLRVEVVDTGVGISQEGQKRLFNQFEQADNSISRKYGGTGLGLAISKNIINLMGGDIWVESVEGHGAAFIFELKTNWGEELSIAMEPAGETRPLRILVVDDAPDVLEYFSTVLDSFSYICETAPSGAEAVQKAIQRKDEGSPFDAYLIDWNMPGMNGGATAKAIRELSDENAIIIMISVADWSDIEEQAKAVGITNFLAKPVMPSTLFNAIQELAKGKLGKPKPAKEQRKIDWSNKTILLAEDIEINREIIFSLLQDSGLNIISAENGSVAVELFTASPDQFDLIFMDVQMPIMDGLTATRTIRALADIPKAATIPIVAMTANAFKEDQEMSMAAGMNGHIAKPIEVSVLFDTLAHYFDM